MINHLSRHRPVTNYSGITIVISKPSRFDLDAGKLLTGRAGDWFNACLSPYTRFDCDIRVLDYNEEGLLPGTKVLMLLGQEALDRFKAPRVVKLTTHRGSPLITNTFMGHELSTDILVLPTFTPQEAFDRKDYEGGGIEDEKGEDKESEKDYQRTQRKNWKFWLYNDIKKAVRLAQHGPRIYPNINYRIFPSSEEVCRVLKTTKNQNLVLDIETDLAHNITCFAFIFTPHDKINFNEPVTVYCVPIKRYNGLHAYDLVEMYRILQAISIAFRDNKVITHNGSFDLFIFVYKYFIPLPKNCWDTMVAHHRLYCEVEKSLGHIISLYTDLPFHKDKGIFDPKTLSDEQQNWHYNGLDVIGTLFAYWGINLELSRFNAIPSATQACRSIRPYLTKQYQGMQLDTKCMIATYEYYDRRRIQMARVCSLLAGRNLNPRSWQQVSAYLYDTLKLPKPLKDPTGELTLLKLYARYNIPSLRTVIEARGAGKLASSLKFKLWKNDRLTCHFKITGTTSFRGASAALLAFRDNPGYGTNDQNFSKKLRRIIISDPGMMLGQTDQAGAEALIVAYLAAEANLRLLFKFGIKPHTYVAMHIASTYWATKLGVPDIDLYLNSPINQLKTLPLWKDLATLISDSDNNPEPRYRFYFIGKQCCHSLNYDASPGMFQLNTLLKSEGSLRFSISEAERYHNLYRNKLFPEITGWHCEIQRLLNSNNRTLYNLFGFPRKFNDAWGRELFKEAYAFIPQSTVGCITHIAFTELQELIDKNDSIMEDVSLLQNGHDSILWQAPKDKVLDVARVIKHHMERKLISPRGEEFQMGSGTSIGLNWEPADKEKIKNPSGLEEIKL